MLTNRIRNKKGKGYILEEEKKKRGKGLHRIRWVIVNKEEKRE
jgi:hypothetical protein